MKLTIIGLVCCLCGCVSTSAQWGAVPVDPCPLEILLPEVRFTDALDVKVEFLPSTLKEILVLRPAYQGFEARLLDDEESLMEPVIEQRPENALFNNFLLPNDLPTSAWIKSKEKQEGAVYETAPGKYQLVVRYILPGKTSRSGDHLCVAVSDVFTVEERSWWVTNASFALPYSQTIRAVQLPGV